METNRVYLEITMRTTNGLCQIPWAIANKG